MTQSAHRPPTEPAGMRVTMHHHGHHLARTSSTVVRPHGRALIDFLLLSIYRSVALRRRGLWNYGDACGTGHLRASWSRARLVGGLPPPPPHVTRVLQGEMSIRELRESNPEPPHSSPFTASFRYAFRSCCDNRMSKSWREELNAIRSIVITIILISSSISISRFMSALPFCLPTKHRCLRKPAERNYAIAPRWLPRPVCVLFWTIIGQGPKLWYWIRYIWAWSWAPVMHS